MASGSKATLNNTPRVRAPGVGKPRKAQFHPTAWPRAGWAMLLALWIPFVIAASAHAAGANAGAGSTKLLVYFSNPRLTPDASNCSAVFPVKRSVPRTRAVATAALQQLFAGPSVIDADVGYRSPFNPATADLLQSIYIRNATAYVNLKDRRIELAGATSSCGAAELRAQIESTLLQYPTILRVIYAIEGEPRTFYEWMNESCGPANDDCAPNAFPPGRPRSAVPHPVTP